MEDSNSNTNSPSSVATAQIQDHFPAAMSKLAPPMPHSQSERIVQFQRSSSLPEDDSGANTDIAKDGVSRRRSMMVDFRYGINSSISDSTRRILEKMDESQVEDAKKAFAAVKQQRRASGLMDGNTLRKLSKAMEEEGAFASIDALQDSNNDERRGISLSRRSSSGAGDSPVTSPAPTRVFSKSMGPLDGGDFEGFSEDDDDDADDDNSNDDKKEQRGSMEDKRAERYMSKSMGDYEEDDQEDDKVEKELPLISRTVGQLKEVDEMADEHLVELVREQSGSHSIGGDSSGIKPFVPTPISQRRRPARQRRKAIVTQSCSAAPNCTWKPLSSNQHDPSPEELGAQDQEDAKGGGIGGFWNKLTSSFKGEDPTSLSNNKVLPSKEPSSSTKEATSKEITGATYFRRGKRKANKFQFLQAVAIFNLALVKQREELGENHTDCGTTLNEIGLCWMMLGERYPAMTAFEEALYILQKHLGDGAMEVAEITNNIWMILHEERCDIENMMKDRIG